MSNQQCRMCGHSFPTVAPGESTPLAPHLRICTGCVAKVVIFDSWRLGHEHHVTFSGNDSYYHYGTRCRLWTGTRSKRRVLLAEFARYQFSHHQIDGDQYAAELERIFDFEAKRKQRDAAFQRECDENRNRQTA